MSLTSHFLYADGSHVAGTIAAVQNGRGVVGVNRNGEIGLKGYSEAMVTSSLEALWYSSRVIVFQLEVM